MKYPDEWQEIKTNGSGVIISENGIFNYTNLLTNKELKLDDEFSLVSGAGDLYIISFISPNTQSGQLFNNNILENSLLKDAKKKAIDENISLSEAIVELLKIWVSGKVVIKGGKK